MNIGKAYFIFVMILSFTVSGSSIFSQSISAEIDRDKIAIGEQITLELKISGIDPNEKILSAWFAMPDSINHLEVVERSKIDTIEVNGIYSFQQKITITSFDSGQWEIPVLSIIINDRVSNIKSTQTTKPISVEIIPVDVSQLKDYHDIKEIIELQEKNSLLILGLIIAITLISFIAIYKLARSGKKRVTASPPLMPGNRPPLEWVLNELEKLQKENLPAKNQAKSHYQILTNICRQYFYKQFQQASLHQTTDEWMVSLHSLMIDQDIKTSFFQLLRLADTVKFARYLPPANDNEQSIPIARQMIVEAQKNTYSNTQNKKS